MLQLLSTLGRALFSAGCIALLLTSGVVLAAAQGTTPDVRLWLFERDPAGRVIRQLEPDGHKVHYSYDSQSRVEQIRFSDGNTISYTYNSAGLRETMTDATGTTRYTYDPLGHLETVTAPNGPSLRYNIDLRGRIRRIELSDGWWTSYTYDLRNRLTTVGSPLGTVTFQYYPERVLDGVPHPQVVRTLPNGVTTTWTYNADAQLIGLRHDHAAGVLLAGWTYTYDKFGRITAIRDAVTQTEYRYVFDDVGRLTTVFVGDHPVETYRYDRGSNQIVAQRSGLTRQYHYDEFGQLNAIADRALRYDLAGRLVYDESSNPTRHYRYDAAGHLVAVILGDREISYRYDGDNRLVERRDGTQVQQWFHALQPEQPQVLAVYENGQPLAHHLLTPRRLAIRHTSGEVAYLLEDYLGNVRVITDASGGAIARLEYSAFGSNDTFPPAAEGFGFAGAWRDPATGLVLLNARWYDTETGRFTSPNPWLGTLWAPATLNRYAYAANDPINLGNVPDTMPQSLDRKPQLPGYGRHSNLQLGRHLIEQQIIRNFERIEQNPHSVFRTVDIYTASFGYQFLDELWSSGVTLWPQTQTADDNWVVQLVDPAQVTLGQAWWETEKTAWNPGALVVPSNEPIAAAGDVFGKTNRLNSASSDSIHGTLNQFPVTTAQLAGITPQVIDTSNALSGPWVKAGGTWLSPITSNTSSPPIARVSDSYLKALTEGIETFGTINGVLLDRESGRLVLIGSADRSSGVSISIDDLAVAFQAATRGSWPGVSIDPDPNNVYSGTMYYRYIGPTEHTHFGHVMGYADRLMKVIGMGQDNENPEQPIHPAISGFKNQFELGLAMGSTGSVWSRFWLLPERIEWAASSDGQTIWNTEASIKVRTQVMALQGNRLVDAPDQHDRASEAFSQWFSSHYAELANEYPIYAELRELAKLVSLVNWLWEHLPAHEFAALAEAFRPKPFDTPKTTPAMKLTQQEGRAALTIFGGVDLKPPRLPASLPHSPLSEAVAQTVRDQLPIRSLPTVAQINIANQHYQAISIPFAGLRPTGSLTLYVTDLAFGYPQSIFRLTRHYSSTITQPGAFGRGWELIVPEIRQNKVGKEEHWVLTNSWRTFEHRLEAPEFVKIERHPDSITLIAKDGSIWEFNQDFKLTRLRTTEGELKHIYENGRLLQMSLTSRDGTTNSIELVYQDNLVVRAVDSFGRVAHYYYDSDQRLIEVRAGEGLDRYHYDAHHHLSSVSTNGISRSFTIAPDGFVTQYEDEHGRSVQLARDVRENGATLIHSSAPGTPTMLFSPNGRVVDLQGERWALSFEHGEEGFTRTLLVDGTVVSRDNLNQKKHAFAHEIVGDQTVDIAFSEDGRPQLTTVTSASDRSQLEIHYDQTGRWLSISDPAGGAYQRDFGPQEELRAVTTPAGTYHIRSTRQGRSVTVSSPVGKEVTFELDVDDAPRSITVDSPGGQFRWQRTAPHDWELGSAGHVLRKLSLDENNRIKQVKAADVTVDVEYSDGGAVVRTPNGRQIVSRVDAKGRLCEVQEYPIGTDRVHPPLRDLTGKAAVIPAERLKAMKERPK